ncbi:hypothetical protein BDL97_01G034400 [Sphagnum fallax]|nr:hypothetical protein BDL97_01G034400 [Sphagnum fallax]KAH8973225.1 hypothetical protein BDL97_01G034400 [Sphagnum fallax]
MPSPGLCRPPFLPAASFESALWLQVSSSHFGVPCCRSSASTSTLSGFLITGVNKSGRRSSRKGNRCKDLHARAWGGVEHRAQQSNEGMQAFLVKKKEKTHLWRACAYGDEIPTQAEAVTGATSTVQAEYKSLPDLDYLQELLAIQQNGPRAIGFFGTRNMGFMHQQLIEILSYAMVITKNHIYTSGASGTNAAVIRGALRAERDDLLTVILPQSLKMQPPESQELLSRVKNVVEMPHNDHLPLIEASRLCNMDILSHVQQVICFAFHDSNLLMETCREAKNMRKIVTLFYLD